MNLTVVIPVYNIAKRLLHFGESLLNILFSMQLRFEIIMVDDGSQDESFLALKRLERSNPSIKAIALKRNLGQHRAIFSGLRHAAGKYILIMDDDMDYALETLPELWQKTLEGHDVVSGHRTTGSRAVSGKNITTKGINFVISAISGQRFHDATSPLKLFKRDLVEDLLSKGSDLRLLIPEYVMMKGENIAEVPLPSSPRRLSESRYTPEKRFKHGLMLLGTFFYFFKIPFLFDEKTRNDE